MLYLTGAETSLAKSSVAPQTDAAKSLGGYISSSPAPNAAVNVLFDLISSETLKNRQKETIALGLVNKLSQAVTNVQLRFICEKEDMSLFKVAAVAVGSDYSMETIANRYQEPISGVFHTATFNRAFVDIKVLTPAESGDTITLSPFGVTVTVSEDGIEGTWSAFEEEFENNDTYEVKRISENVFRITRRDTTVVTATTCTYTTTGTFNGTFLSQYQNGETGSVTLIDSDSSLAAGAAIGLWIQRTIKPNKYLSNEKLLEDYKNHVIMPTLEEIGLDISYSLVVPNEEETEGKITEENTETNNTPTDTENTEVDNETDNNTDLSQTL